MTFYDRVEILSFESIVRRSVGWAESEACPPSNSQGGWARRYAPLPTLQILVVSEAPSAIHLQRSNEGFLRNVDLAELPHLLLAFLLLLQKLAFARDVAAVALGGDVLAQRADGFAGDDLAADRSLDRNHEHVGRDQILHLLDHGAAAALGAGTMHQHAERIDRLGVDEDLHLDEVGRL